jgi:hypothetical protein
MAATLLASGAAERSGGDSYQVIVHVDAAALGDKRRTQAGPGVPTAAGHEPDSACQLDDGRLLHPETARRLACDASVVRILERDGRPLSVGRRTRSVPPALRRALQARDHCCASAGPTVAPSPPGPICGRFRTTSSGATAGAGSRIHPDRCASRWTGERIDLALNIDALVGSDPRLE